MPRLTEDQAALLAELEALLPMIAAECRANIEQIDRVLRENELRMAPYRPILRRIRKRVERAGYIV